MSSTYGCDGAGIAPIAGHVFDAHTSYEDAAVAEVAEEAGLTVVPETLEFVVGGYRANRCAGGDGRVTDAEWRAEPGMEPVWCRWLVLADVTSAPPEDLAAIDAYIHSC